MNKATKIKLIAWGVFGLAVGSLPASIILNAPEAKAGGVQISTSAVAPLPAPTSSSDYFGENEVRDAEEAPAQEKPRPASKKTHRAEIQTKVWTCKRIPLVQQGRPGARTVLYCDYL